VPQDPLPPSGRFRRRGAAADRDDDHTDGNELAGLLAEAFAADITAMPRRCGDCGLEAPLAAHRVHHGAGLVARCPGCDGVALRVGVFEQTLTLTWSGVLSVARPG
jgi:hypothetical protein